MPSASRETLAQRIEELKGEERSEVNIERAKEGKKERERERERRKRMVCRG